jgi:hypothetical protein
MPAEEIARSGVAGSAAADQPGTDPGHVPRLGPNPPARSGLTLEARLRQVGLA